MPDFTTPPQHLHFGVFEVNVSARELRKKGVRVKIQQQPFELLLLLLARPGHVLSRDDLRRKLWPSDVYVDFDRSLNKAMVKLREALGDSSESPLYIETLPRLGYRFIGPVTHPQIAQDSATLPVTPSPEMFVPSEDISGKSAIGSIASRVEASEYPPASALPGSYPAENLPGARWPRIAAAALILIATSATALAVHKHNLSSATIHSLAVLPLDNLSGDPSQDYFADGMTDELTTMLAKNSTLNVTSRTSVMQYKAAHQPLPEIARALGVDAILEGSVVRSSDKVHVTIQLIQASTDTHLWAESYDRDVKDLVPLPGEAALSIAKRLNADVLHPPIVRYVSPEAHDAYLRGRYIWFTGNNEDAGPFLRRATELQPDYALGWAGLSAYYGAGVLGGQLAPAVALPQLKAAALKAVELDDSLPDGHVSLAGAFFLTDWNFDRAEQEIHRALELDPKFAECHHLHSKMLAAVNRYPEAIAEQKIAMEIDPFSRPYGMAHTYGLTRQCDAAIDDAKQRLKTAESGDLYWTLSEGYRCKHMLNESVPPWAKALAMWGATELAANTRQAFAQGGYRTVLRLRIRDLEKHAEQSYISPMHLAVFYAELGEREKTLRLLEQAYQEHSAQLLWLQSDTAFDFLHTDDRYRAIVNGIGLPPAY
jgi:TolB-like protein/DNA-binding winged helix-turn-helix (wHTH) protein